MGSLYRYSLLGLLCLGLLGALVTGRSVAFLTDTGAASANQFAAGTVVLDVTESVVGALTVSSLVPGDAIWADVTLQNGGTLGLLYAMTTTTSGDPSLASALQLVIRTKSGTPCSAADGTVLYGPGELALAAFGDPAHGPHAGDRALAPGTSDALCFELALPAGVSPTLQARSVTATFTFDAEQQ